MANNWFDKKSGKIGWASFNLNNSNASFKLFTKTIVKKYQKDTISYYASGLVYSTLLALIPCITIIFSLLGNWGVLSSFIQMTGSFLENVFGVATGIKMVQLLTKYTANAGTLGFVGIVSFVITYLLLINKIIIIINKIFHSEIKANATKRFISYLAFLFIGTFMLAIYLSVVSVSSSWFASLTGFQPKVFSTFSKIIFPRVILFVIIFLIFVLAPDTKVKISSALYGTFFTAFGIDILSAVFKRVATSMVNYSVVYGSLSVIFVFLLWLFLLWQVVLVGLEIVYIEQFKPYENQSEVGNGYNQLAELINISLLVAENYKNGKGATSLGNIERGLTIDNERLMKLLSLLEKGNIIYKIERNGSAYFPAKPLSDIKIRQIISLSFSSTSKEKLNKANLGLKYSLHFLNAGVANIKDKSLKDLIAEFENL